MHVALAQAQEDRRREHLTRAREHFTRAARLDPTFASALAEQASTYLIEGEDAAEGVPFAEAAYRRMPGSLEIQLVVARLEAGRGNRSTARIHAREIASRGHGLPVAEEAEALLDSLRRE